jgi:excisionase family DNA binding protein
MKNFLTVSEVAKIENVSGMTVVRWIKKGVFPNSRKVGRSYRISIIDFQKWHETTKIFIPVTERPNDRSNEHTNS